MSATPVHERINLTPFAVDLGFCLDPEGRDVAAALLKATYVFTPSGVVSVAKGEALLPVFPFDLYWGKPDASSLRYGGDAVPRRRGTDVAVNGHVYGQGRAVVQAGFRVSTLEKVIEATGPRRWVKAGPSVSIVGPRKLEKVALRYEHAFGGVLQGPKGKGAWAENPVGTGYAARAQEGAECPQLFYPGQQYHTVDDRPAPASLGFIPSSWRQRARFAGTFDAAWQERRRPLFPEDFDDRFFNAVPQDQVLAPKLSGGERVALHNLHPTARNVTFEVPRHRFLAVFNVRGREEALQMEANTLLIEPDAGRFAITWQASCFPGEALRQLRSVTFRKQRIATAKVNKDTGERVDNQGR